MYAHNIHTRGEGYVCDGIDVMDFLFQEMWTCLLNKKTPLYAPYVMKLIISQETGVPLVTTNLVPHKPVRPQKNFSKKEKERVPYSDLEGEIGEDDEDIEEDDDEEEPETMDISPPRRPRMKNAGNTFVPSSKEFVKKKVKGLDWFKQTILCMNIAICKSQHDAYKTNHEILKHVRPPRT